MSNKPSIFDIDYTPEQLKLLEEFDALTIRMKEAQVPHLGLTLKNEGVRLSVTSFGHVGAMISYTMFRDERFLDVVIQAMECVAEYYRDYPEEALRKQP